MSDSSILLDRNGGVLTITINRPERGNALDADAVGRLIDVLSSVVVTPGDVRAILLRGSGTNFCTGADISASGTSPTIRPPIGHMVRSLAVGPHRLIELLWNCPLPIVAELTGRTSGLGLHVALACDITIAAESSTFAEPFSERGFNVDSGGSWLLPRVIGMARAKQILYTANVIDAATAFSWGIVTELVDDDVVVARAHEVACTMATRPTFAISSMKQLLHEGVEGSLSDALRREAAAIELTIRSDDFKEGMRAFSERRKPNFEGH